MVIFSLFPRLAEWILYGFLLWHWFWFYWVQYWMVCAVIAGMVLSVCHSHFQKRLNLKCKMPIKLFFCLLNCLSSWVKVHMIFNLCSSIHKSETDRPSVRFLTASSHLLKCLESDLPAAPETLTTTDLWSPKTLMVMDGTNGRWWRQRGGPWGLPWLQQETESIYCKSTQRNAESVLKDWEFGEFTVKIDKCVGFSDT